MRTITTALIGWCFGMFAIIATEAEPKPVAKSAPSIKDVQGPNQFLTLEGKQAGLWVTPGSSEVKGATLYYIAGQGPVIALYDYTAAKKQKCTAHQFAVFLDEGKPFIQINAPDKELKRIDLDKLADMLAEWEQKQKR